MARTRNPKIWIVSVWFAGERREWDYVVATRRQAEAQAERILADDSSLTRVDGDRCEVNQVVVYSDYSYYFGA